MVTKSKSSSTTPIIGVYSLRGVVNKNAVTIKQIDSLQPGEQLKNTPIMKYSISDKTQIIGEVLACNITNHRLMSTKKQPILCINTYMNKPLKVSLLYTFQLFFTIESDIRSAESLLNDEHTGVFSLELQRNGESIPLDKDFTHFKGEDVLLDELVEFTKSEGIVDILNDTAYEEELKIAEKYNSGHDHTDMTSGITDLKSVDISDFY